MKESGKSNGIEEGKSNSWLQSYKCFPFKEYLEIQKKKFFDVNMYYYV